MATYADTLDKLNAAKATGANYVLVELDEGEIQLSLDEAFDVWEELAPGEAFDVTAIYYSVD